MTWSLCGILHFSLGFGSLNFNSTDHDLSINCNLPWNLIAVLLKAGTVCLLTLSWQTLYCKDPRASDKSSTWMCCVVISFVARMSRYLGMTLYTTIILCDKRLAVDSNLFVLDSSVFTKPFSLICMRINAWSVIVEFVHVKRCRNVADM